MKKSLEVNSPEYREIIAKLTSGKPLSNLPPLRIPVSPLPSSAVKLPANVSPAPVSKADLPPLSKFTLPPIASPASVSKVALPPIASPASVSKVSLPPISLVKLPSTQSKSPPTQSKFLTGIKDVNLLVLTNLDDESLLNLCQVNKEAARICDDENFWRNRFMGKYGKFNKPNNLTWKRLYLKSLRGYNLFRKGLTDEGYVAKNKLNENDELLLVDIEMMFIFKKTKYDRRELTALVDNKLLFEKNIPTAKNYHVKTPFFENRSKMMKWMKQNDTNKDPDRFDKYSFDNFRFYI